MSNLTIGIGGEDAGRIATGPLSPGFEPLHPLIKAMRFNLSAWPWTDEMNEHRPTGVLPNLAPVGLQFVARKMQAKTGRINPGTAPRSGPPYAGV